ncbi:unnamed protein product, partial [Symbiodinium pilosum]
VRGTTVVSKLWLLVLVYRSSREERAFLLKMITKFTAFLFFCAMPFRIYSLEHAETHSAASVTLGPLYFVMLIVGFLGIPGLARLPGGLFLVQVILCRGCAWPGIGWRNIRCRPKCLEPAGDCDPSSSSQGESTD